MDYITDVKSNASKVWACKGPCLTRFTRQNVKRLTSAKSCSLLLRVSRLIRLIGLWLDLCRLGHLWLGHLRLWLWLWLLNYRSGCLDIFLCIISCVLGLCLGFLSSLRRFLSRILSVLLCLLHCPLGFLSDLLCVILSSVGASSVRLRGAGLLVVRLHLRVRGLLNCCLLLLCGSLKLCISGLFLGSFSLGLGRRGSLVGLFLLLSLGSSYALLLSLQLLLLGFDSLLIGLLLLLDELSLCLLLVSLSLLLGLLLGKLLISLLLGLFGLSCLLFSHFLLDLGGRLGLGIASGFSSLFGRLLGLGGLFGSLGNLLSLLLLLLELLVVVGL